MQLVTRSVGRLMGFKILLLAGREAFLAPIPPPPPKKKKKKMRRTDLY